MTLKNFASRVAALKCPDCGAVQPIYFSPALKSRVRPEEVTLACPGCGVPLRMAFVTGGKGREMLLWLLVAIGMAVITLGIQAVFAGKSMPTGAGLWVLAGSGAVILYVGALLMTGLIVGATRRMVRP